MVKTAPLPVDLPVNRFRWKRFAHRVHHLNVAHRGDYSVERLIALEAYCRKVSFLRVLGVCIVFPLPALGLAILIECIRLKDPKEGWQANYAAFIRYMIGCIAIAIGGALQIRQLVPRLDLSAVQIVFIAVGAALCTTGAMIIVSSQWVFPVPFGLVLAIPVFPISFFCFFRLGLRDKQLRVSADLGQQLKQQVIIILVQATMSIIYPAFGAVYCSLSSTSKAFFVVLLPIMKLVMQNVMVWASGHLKEYIAGITVFSVEGFNALYMSKCMQSGTLMTYLVIMTFDLLESLMAFLDMQTQANPVQKLKQPSNRLEPKQNLLQVLVELCKQPYMLCAPGDSVARIRSPISLQLSDNDTMMLEKICTMHGQNTVMKVATKHYIPNLNQVKGSVAPTETDPHSLAKLKEMKNSQTETEKMSMAQKQKLVHQALKLLFATEYHVLVEYVECIVPMIYGVYVAVLVHLPNAAYFPETRNMTPDQVQVMANSILLYAGLEIVSFIGLHYAIKRRFGFSPVYLLAFVLENQAVEFQARIVVWLIFVLMLTLEHFGTFTGIKFQLRSDNRSINFMVAISSRCRLHASVQVAARLIPCIRAPISVHCRSSSCEDKQSPSQEFGKFRR